MLTAMACIGAALVTVFAAGVITGLLRRCAEHYRVQFEESRARALVWQYVLGFRDPFPGMVIDGKRIANSMVRRPEPAPKTVAEQIADEMQIERAGRQLVAAGVFAEIEFPMELPTGEIRQMKPPPMLWELTEKGARLALCKVESVDGF